jgi:site-specific DNA-methyltransferase (adenine-specific)
MHHFYNHSSETMGEVEDDSVALTVTSPPYWNAIDYDRHSAEGDAAWYRTRKYQEGFVEYDEYLAFCVRIFDEVRRKTKPGGFCAVVIGTVLYNRKHIPVPFDFTSLMVESGWEFHQDIIWHKTTAGVKRAGVTIQKPYPGYYYPNIMTEYILVFRKPGDPIYRNANGHKEESRFEIDRLFTMDTANNIWHIAPVPPRTIEHPCPFPEEIPYRLTRMYSYVGDRVLDPFLGSGQTAKVAVALERVALGYDTSTRYVELAEQRVKEPLKIRPKQLIARFEKIDVDAPSGNSPRKPERVEGDQVRLLD